MGCENSCPPEPFNKPGNKILAEWEPNKWYSASVVKSGWLKWTISFEDGVTKQCLCKQLAIDKSVPIEKLNPKDKVIAKWRGGNWFTGNIIKIDRPNNNVQIIFYDGIIETVPISDIRSHP